jgi:hypothetical protein
MGCGQDSCTCVARPGGCRCLCGACQAVECPVCHDEGHVGDADRIGQRCDHCGDIFGYDVCPRCNAHGVRDEWLAAKKMVVGF